MLTRLSTTLVLLALIVQGYANAAGFKEMKLYLNVRIESVPSGATVMFDGQALGVTPFKVKLPWVVNRFTGRPTENTKPWELTFIVGDQAEVATYDPLSLPKEGKGFRSKLLINYLMTGDPQSYVPSAQGGGYGGRVSRDNPGGTDMENTIIRWFVDSNPQGARIYWRVVSNCPQEVKNTNETYLMTTPYEETRAFNILGLTYENSTNVQIEIKLEKSGYETQVKRFNVRQAIDQQEISSFFELVPKAGQRQPQYYQQPQYQQPQPQHYPQQQYGQPQQQYPQYQQPQLQYGQPYYQPQGQYY